MGGRGAPLPDRGTPLPDNPLLGNVAQFDARDEGRDEGRLKFGGIEPGRGV